MGFKKKPRPDNQKNKKKARRYKHEGNPNNPVRKYYCPDHERWHTLTPGQAKGQEPIECDGHEETIDFSHIDRIIARSSK